MRPVCPSGLEKIGQYEGGAFDRNLIITRSLPLNAKPSFEHRGLDIFPPRAVVKIDNVLLKFPF